MNHSDDRHKVKKLLIDSKIALNNFFIKPIGLGMNNRAYLVSTLEKKYLAKFYFSSLKDKRTRLSNEFSFLEFLKKIGVENVPQPILKSDLYNLGIYEFIEGRPFLASDLNEQHILSAARFFSALNNKAHTKHAEQLSYASEAFLDLDKYMRQIDLRIIALKDSIKFQGKSIGPTKFMSDLQKRWGSLKLNLSLNKDFIMQNNTLCVSPSDFGFHNTLLKKDKLFFLDFEYAGKDDPAKFLADFFIQPEIKVSLDYMETFANKAFEPFQDKEILIDRTMKLFPMLQVKWCCIIMNEFLPETAKRRMFSNPDLDIQESKNIQLNKAKLILSEVNC
jgi:thiamine kinase-like enzyme